MGFMCSTVGRKILMAVSGFLLVLFLSVHFLGNSLIYFGEINAYGEKLHSLPILVWVSRIGMVILLAVHIFFGIKLTLENRAARPQAYAVKKELRATAAGKTMIWTGLAIALFMIYHLLHFTLRMTNPDISSGVDALGRPDVFKMVTLSFKNILISGAYIAALIALALHIYHGIQSFVQTIGMNSDKSLPRVESAGRGIAIILFLGYASIPLAIIIGLLSYKG
jgi:succinate dehydrogenase / fumarate reductase, cytochrome b subunit